MFVSVLGNMAHSRNISLSDRSVGNIFSEKQNFSLFDFFKSRKSVNKFGLSVSVNARDSDNLTSANTERNIFDRVFFMYTALSVKPLDFKNGIADGVFVFLNNKFNVSADHHARKFVLGRIFDIDSAHIFAFTQNSTAIRYFHYLVQFVRNEKYRFSLCRKVTHYLHKFRYLLRSKNRGGFVKYKYFVFSVKHFQNFGSLLHSDGDIFDNRIGVNAESVFIRKFKYLFACDALLQKARFRRFDTEHYIVENGKTLNKFEMLMYHSYSERIRIVRVFYADLFAVLVDLTLFGLIYTEKNGHQSRFSRAVLAEKRVDFTFFKSESYIVVRGYSRKPFRYMQHFYRILFRHNDLPLSYCFFLFLCKTGVSVFGHPCQCSGNLIFSIPLF